VNLVARSPREFTHVATSYLVHPRRAVPRPRAEVRRALQQLSEHARLGGDAAGSVH